MCAGLTWEKKVCAGLTWEKKSVCRANMGEKSVCRANMGKKLKQSEAAASSSSGERKIWMQTPMKEGRRRKNIFNISIFFMTLPHHSRIVLVLCNVWVGWISVSITITDVQKTTWFDCAMFGVGVGALSGLRSVSVTDSSSTYGSGVQRGCKGVIWIGCSSVSSTSSGF